MAKKKFIIEFDADTGKFTQGIDEATASVKDLNKEAEKTGEGLGEIEGIADNLSGGLVSGFRAGIAGAKNMAKGMVTLKGAIAATGVGLLVVALGSIYAAMSSSEEGAKKLRVATAFLGVGMEKLMDAIAPLGEILISMFEDPAEAITGLWDLIKTNIVNRFMGLVDTFKSVGKVLQGVFTLDWDLIKEGGEEAAESFIQFSTGVDDYLGKLKTGIDGATDATKKALALTEKLVAAQDVVRKSTNKLIVANANLEKSIAKEQKTIDDTTLSYEDRKAAVDRQSESSEKLANNIAEQAKLEEGLIKFQLSYTSGIEARRDLEDQLAEKVADRINAESAVAQVQQDNAQKSREIDLEEIERKKSIYNTTASLKLEGIADEGKRIEAEFEMRKKQLEEELTLLKASDEEKLIALALLDAGKILALQDYHAQVKEVEDKADEDKVAAAKTTWAALLAEGDKAVAKQKAADAAVLSSKLALTKGIGAGIGALGALMREGSAEAKAMALTEIGINTAVGFIQGLDIAQKSAKAMGPGAAFAMPIFYASQIAAVLSAAAQARNVLKSGGSGGKPSMPSTPSIGGGGGGSTSEPTPPTIDFGFLETGANQTAIQAYVVEQNVSDSQQANQLIQDQSAL